jgi:hypothetical protein
MKITLNHRARERGFIWAVVGLLVLATGVYVTVKLAQFCRKHLGPPAQSPGQTDTNNVFTNAAANHLPPGVRPAMALTPSKQFGQDGPSFSIQYGWSTSDHGGFYLWIMPGTNVEASEGHSASLSLVISRSPDLTHWTPVLKNPSVLLDSVQNWTDTNATGDHLFYRVEIPEL